MVLLVMKSSTTIITAYFDIGRGDWTANKGFREKLARSVDVYFSYFERLAALENEMIIFTSPDLKQGLKRFATENQQRLSLSI